MGGAKLEWQLVQDKESLLGPHTLSYTPSSLSERPISGTVFTHQQTEKWIHKQAISGASVVGGKALAGLALNSCRPEGKV